MNDRPETPIPDVPDGQSIKLSKLRTTCRKCGAVLPGPVEICPICYASQERKPKKTNFINTIALIAFIAGIAGFAIWVLFYA